MPQIKEENLTTDLEETEKICNKKYKKIDDEIEEIKYVTPSGKPKKDRKFVFSLEVKKIVLNSKMLTDESINIAQKLLKKQFPTIGGFMDTCLGNNQQFDIIPRDKPYIQVLHVPSRSFTTTLDMCCKHP